MAGKSIKVQYRIQISKDEVSAEVSVWQNGRYVKVWRGATKEPPKRLSHIISKNTRKGRDVTIAYSISQNRDSTTEIKAFGSTVFRGHLSELPRLLQHLDHPVRSAA